MPLCFSSENSKRCSTTLIKLRGQTHTILITCILEMGMNSLKVPLTQLIMKEVRRHQRLKE